MQTKDKVLLITVNKYQLICLIHRYLYYVKDQPLITDQQYDLFESRLKRAAEQAGATVHQASDNYYMCPTRFPGSSIQDDYPRRIEQIAESLLEHRFDLFTHAVSALPPLEEGSLF